MFLNESFTQRFSGEKRINFQIKCKSNTLFGQFFYNSNNGKSAGKILPMQRFVAEYPRPYILRVSNETWLLFIPRSWLFYMSSSLQSIFVTNGVCSKNSTGQYRDKYVGLEKAYWLILSWNGSIYFTKHPKMLRDIVLLASRRLSSHLCVNNATS